MTGVRRFWNERESVTWAEIARSHPEITEDWEAMKRYREQMGIHIH